MDNAYGAKAVQQVLYNIMAGCSTGVKAKVGHALLSGRSNVAAKRITLP